MNINQLPRETLTTVFEFLSPTELAESSQVCKTWRDTAREDSIWDNMPSNNLAPYTNLRQYHLSGFLPLKRLSEYNKIVQNFLKTLDPNQVSTLTVYFNSVTYIQVKIGMHSQDHDRVDQETHCLIQANDFQLPIPRSSFAHVWYPRNWSDEVNTGWEENNAGDRVLTNISVYAHIQQDLPGNENPPLSLTERIGDMVDKTLNQSMEQIKKVKNRRLCLPTLVCLAAYAVIGAAVFFVS